LDQVFNSIRQANLKLKPSKCSLFQRHVEFLGHLVSGDGIAMQPDKIKAIRTWPECRNVTEVRAFLGTCGYYRRFIKDFSVIASPLYELLKKNEPFKWTDEQQQAFRTLKDRLMMEPILALPSDTGQYVLDTDASDKGLGAVLDGHRRRTSDRLRLKDTPATGVEVRNYPEKIVSRCVRVETVPAILAWKAYRHPDGPCSTVMVETYTETHATASTVVDIHRGIRLRNPTPGRTEAR